ncbi:DNA polymerase theta-like [Patiria miniata]|uniref:DNA polymerase theta n=1 Tax=Patiria miniata TaxID=46514 RepID=A0A913YXL1_PATMI|nr:DNA polymerase theta-like [Patiria miniata]
MKKLSSTWKQQKQVRTRQEAQISKSAMPASSKALPSSGLHETKTKRLGQHAVPISASSSLIIGHSNKQSTNQEETQRGKANGCFDGETQATFRRSPRLKEQKRKEIYGSVKSSDSNQLRTCTSRDGEHQEAGSFNSFFTGDLDDDVLQAMEEAEAIYCHQHQQAGTSVITGTPHRGSTRAQTNGTRNDQVETRANAGTLLDVLPETGAEVCQLIPSKPSGMETNSVTGALNPEFQNSEDLFTEIKPSDIGERSRSSSTGGKVPLNELQQKHELLTNVRLHNSSISNIPTDEKKQTNELKMNLRGKLPSKSNDKCATPSAILNELNTNSNVDNLEQGTPLLPKGPSKNAMNYFVNTEKENSPAGQVYCFDSQSQSQSPNNNEQHEKSVARSGKGVSGKQNGTSDAKEPSRCPEITLNSVSREVKSLKCTKSAVVQGTSQQDAESTCSGPPSPPSGMNPRTQPPADPLLLSSWGLPDQVLAQYHRRHITQMFPWQAQCLALGSILDGGNLVYSAPTSAGKTLVAELLILKRVLETKKKALLILPFVSVAREKMFYLQGIFQDAGVCVGGYMGSESPTGGFKAIDVAVCTIEKANSLVNRLLEENKVDQLGIIVVDELHMVGDAHRGYLLELLLTKVRYITRKMQDVAHTVPTGKENNVTTPAANNSIQIVGMSATLPNLDHLAKWLDAELYHTDFRPVPLTQTVKVGRTIYDASLARLREVDPHRASIPGDEDQILSLCLETLAMGCSVLIFCPTKNWCEKLAENMAREIARLTGMIPGHTRDEGVSINLNKQSLQDVLEQLRRIPVCLDPVLRRTVPCGVAYHHAGLSFDERDIVEGAFRQSSIKILVATSTLSSGVNLPARRVIIRSLMFNRRVLDPLVYRQMAGRAGRKGVDTEGESILICKPSERDKAAKLLQAPLPPVQSCLKKQGQDLSNSMKRAILEVIASGAASTPDEVSCYAGCTLLAVGLTPGSSDQERGPAEDGATTAGAIHRCVKFLQDQEFVILQKVQRGDESEEVLRPTQLGSATLASALSPDEALVVFSELQRARKNFVLENDLHLLYQVTPIYDQGFQPDWYQFMCTWENLPSDQRRVAELVGVEERFLIRAAQGALSTHNARLQHALAVHKRFYTTLILNDLVKEMPVVAAARKYGCARGQLQSLQQSAATFAGMVTAFCSKLGWTNMELLLAQYQSRLTFGVQRELCDLVRISLLNAFRARLLYNSGFASVAAVAAAKPADVESVLRRAVPFQSSRKAIDEQQYEVEERKHSRCIWVTGRKGLTEQQAALLIVQEAKDLLKADLGALGVEWKPQEEPPRSLTSHNDADEIQNEKKVSPSRIQPPRINCDTKEQRSSAVQEIALQVESKPQGVPHSPLIRSGDVADESRDKERTMLSRIQLPRSNSDVKDQCPSAVQQAAPRVQLKPQKEPPHPLRSVNIVDESWNKERTMPSSIQPSSTNLSTTVLDLKSFHSVKVDTNKDQSNDAAGTLGLVRNIQRDGCQLSPSKVAQKTTNDTSSKTKPPVSASIFPAEELRHQNSTTQVIPANGVCTRTMGQGRTLTIKADVHMDASLSGSTSFQNFSPAKHCESNPRIKESTSKSKSKIKPMSDCNSVIHISPQSSNEMVVSVRERCTNQIAANQGTASTSDAVIKKHVKDLTTPKAATLHNQQIVQETSPELFSLPNSPPVMQTETPVPNNVINTPAKNDKPSPKNSLPISPFFSPLDSQMLKFLEQQENAHLLETSANINQNPIQVVEEAPPTNVQNPKNPSMSTNAKFSLVQESQSSLAFSPLDPEVLRLMDCYQEEESKKDLQVKRDGDKTPISSSKSYQSSPSYSPLDSQAILFNDSTTSDLRLSQDQKSATPAAAADLQFTSFQTLDSQALNLIDGFHTSKNDLAAESASPALKSHNKTKMSAKFTRKKNSLKSIQRKSTVKTRSSSHKKQKLVLTFCQTESPYSEFFQDEEMSLDLAETLECSFVIDRTEPLMEGVSTAQSTSLKHPNRSYRPGKPNASHLAHVNSRRKSCSVRDTLEGMATGNMEKGEPPVYSQLEADLALAAEWNDSFSFDEGEREAITSLPKSNPVQNKQVGISDSGGKCVSELQQKGNVMSSNGQNANKNGRMNGDICNVKTPPKTLCSTAKVGKSSTTLRKRCTSRAARFGETPLLDSSTDKKFDEQLSPGTIEMLDLFAGDSFSKTSCPSSKLKPKTPKRSNGQHASSTNEYKSMGKSTKTVVINPTSATVSGKSPCTYHRNTNLSSDPGLVSTNKETKSTRAERLKRRSSESVSKLVGEPIPTKKPFRKERSPSVNDEPTSETPDNRRKSDGDLISPTPPKEKPNTPKLFKGTPKHKSSRDISTEEDTPRSLRLRERLSADHKQGTKSSKVARSLANQQNNQSQKRRKSPRSNQSVHPNRLASPPNTQQLGSPLNSHDDLNAAILPELHLHLDSESSFEVEPPTPPKGRPCSSQRSASSREAQHLASIQHSSPKVSNTQGTFTIIDVCSSKELFHTFLKEWSTKSRYSLSVACERYHPPVEGRGIGGNIRQAAPRPKKPDALDGFQVGDESLIVIGLAICWEEKDAYFISFQRELSNVDPDDSLAQPPLDPRLPVAQRLQAVKTNLELEKLSVRNRTQEVVKMAFDCKEHYKVLSRGCGIRLGGGLADPKVAHWLIDPGAKERNLHGLVTHYVPQDGQILEGLSGGLGLGSLGLMSQEPGTGRLRAATESVLVLALMDHLEPTLKEERLYKAFTEVEMPCMRVLARMELTGFGFSQAECESQKAVMQTKLAALEEQAYQMAGHGFSLTSPEDIAQVLYVELRLPPNGDPSLTTTAPLRKTLGGRGGRARLPKHFSTCKNSLEKLRPFHPLPGVVLEWRRITAAVTKVVYPLLKERQADSKLGGERIYASCQTHTATGRVCLSDPNIQAIPRDFEIEMPSAIGESPPLALGAPAQSYPTRARVRQTQGRGQQTRGASMSKEGDKPGPSCAVSVRHAFCPFQGGVLLAADYSQLELRILAHLSGDSKLAGILNGGGDVFKCIAAQWKQTTESQVTPNLRQQAKQMCYGMVYGIGAKALGQQLGESEEDAAAFMDSFKMQYKGMKNYIRDTVERCRTTGFVETILHRKRFLPAITHANPAARSQAERQAVNTTIQGSAADLVKLAMVKIDRRLAEEFPNTKVTHRHRVEFESGLTQRKKGRKGVATTPSGAFLVLQLHDELIYEVHREDVIQVAQLVKAEMESALVLSVRLPVKVKVGPTWGSMEDLDL